MLVVYCIFDHPATVNVCLSFHHYSKGVIWRQELHPSWLIALACVGFCVGIWAAQYLTISSGMGVVAGLLLIVMIVVRKVVAAPLAVLLAVLGGISYGSGSMYQNQRLSRLFGQQITIQGTVREDSTTKASGQLFLQLHSLSVGGHEVGGALWVSTALKAEIVRGDSVTLAGTIDKGFGNFSGMMQQASVIEVVRPFPGDIGRVIRDWFAAAVRKVIPEPQVSLGVGFLTGQKSALPEDLSEYLRIAGLTHIVVASGYNLTILVRLARRLFVNHSKFLALSVSRST